MDTGSVSSSVAGSFQDLPENFCVTLTSSASSLPVVSNSCPPPMSGMNEKAELFHMEMVGGDSEQATPIEEEDEDEILDVKSLGEDEDMVGGMEGVDSSFRMSSNRLVSESKKRETTPSPFPGNSRETTVEVSDEASNTTTDQATSEHSQAHSEERGVGGANGEVVVGGADGEIVRRNNTSKVKRPLSYKLATDEEQSLVNLLTEAGVPVPNLEVEEVSVVNEGLLISPQRKANRQSEKVKKAKKISNTNIRRSTSTVTQSSQAAVTLRHTLDISRGPKTQSSRVSSSNYSLPSLSSIAVARNSLLMWSRVDDLVKKELSTGTYPAPLIGCIPPSALKMFATKDTEKAPPTSPSTHSQSGKEGAWLDYRSVAHVVWLC